MVIKVKCQTSSPHAIRMKIGRRAYQPCDPTNFICNLRVTNPGRRSRIRKSFFLRSSFVLPSYFLRYVYMVSISWLYHAYIMPIWFLRTSFVDPSLILYTSCTLEIWSAGFSHLFAIGCGVGKNGLKLLRVAMMRSVLLWFLHAGFTFSTWFFKTMWVSTLNKEKSCQIEHCPVVPS